MPQKLPIFNQVQNWLDEVESTKQAAVKDPGGYTGATSHPSKDVDDRTRDANEGFRSKENTQDNKEDRGPASVDSTSPGAGGDQASHQMQVGTTKSETGKDPSVEDDYKGTKEDGTTSHPADAEDVGKKYGSLAAKGDITELLRLHKQASDNLLAKITISLQKETTQPVAAPVANKTAAEKPAEKAATPANPTDAAATKDAAKVAADAGYELAASLGYQTKEAADAAAEQLFTSIIKEASDDADRVGPFLLTYMAEREKAAKAKAAASDEGGDGEDHKDSPADAGPPGLDAGATPPPADAAAGGAMPPPGADPMGGDVPPGAGDMGGGGGGGAPGMDQDAALQELAMALMELGISPDALAQAAASGGGGAPGGAPPGAGAMPPPPPGGDMGAPPGGASPSGASGGPADLGGKIASAVKDFMRSGKFEVRPAKTAAERAYRNEMKGYIMEVVGNR